MPTYDFEDAAGKVYGVAFAFSEAPKIGETITVGGERLTRVPSLPQAKVATNIGFTSNTLPRHWPYAQRHEPGTGKPVFHSQREVDEAVAKSRDTRNDHVEYV